MLALGGWLLIILGCCFGRSDTFSLVPTFLGSMGVFMLERFRRVVVSVRFIIVSVVVSMIMTVVVTVIVTVGVAMRVSMCVIMVITTEMVVTVA